MARYYTEQQIADAIRDAMAKWDKPWDVNPTRDREEFATMVGKSLDPKKALEMYFQLDNTNNRLLGVNSIDYTKMWVYRNEQ